MGPLGDDRRGSRGFGGVRADLGGYGKNRSESGVSRKQNPPAARTAIDGGDGGTDTSDETPRRSRKVVNLCTWPVCVKIGKIGGGEREPTQDSTFRAWSLPKTALSVRGTSPPKPRTGISEEGVLSPQALMR